VGVLLLLVLILAAVLVPPALRAHAARQDAFLLSIGSTPESAPALPRSARIQRRRRIAGGLLVAMATTLVVGLLPTFRVLLVVHLFLVNAFLAYIGLLAFWADRAARAQLAAQAEPAVAERALAEAPARRRRLRERRPSMLPDLAPVA
jgi:predicted lipid-binding transport protein (Tim44 family)